MRIPLIILHSSHTYPIYSKIEKPKYEDCAVDAFSRTFSSSTSRSWQHTASPVASSKTTIHHLPAEVLCVIFSFVYVNVYQHSRWYGDYPEEDKWLEQDLMSTSLFPYAPASVCSFWRDAMSSLPKSWGRVVIFVDPPATPLTIVSSQLSWSGDGQLDVFITRRSFHDIDTVDGWHERSQVFAIMNLILPHIHRIRDFSIDVMFSSSLPSILTDFRGTATMMLNLELKCREDDGGSDRSDSIALTDVEGFRCPKLKFLTIDGRNCYEACRRDPQWTNKIASIVKLTISHFQPNPGESFTSRELLFPLPTISNLDNLCINDLALDPSPEPFDLPDLGLPLGEYLTFEDIDGFDVVDQIICFRNDPLFLSFTRCNFEVTDEFDYIHDSGNGGELRLTQISHDLAPLLRLWHGHWLSVINCPRFDDALLDAMGSQEDGVFSCATYLKYLFISDCTNFSVAALRRFVESRLHLPVPTASQAMNQFTPRVCFIGNLPSMSQEERAWFDADLPDAYTFSQNWLL